MNLACVVPDGIQHTPIVNLYLYDFSLRCRQQKKGTSVDMYNIMRRTTK